jgi:hypothetical protein
MPGISTTITMTLLAGRLLARLPGRRAEQLNATHGILMVQPLASGSWGIRRATYVSASMV